MPRDHVINLGTKSGVEAEIDGFAVKYILAFGNGEFTVMGRGPGHLDRVLTIEHGRPDEEVDIFWHFESFLVQ